MTDLTTGLALLDYAGEKNTRDLLEKGASGLNKIQSVRDVTVEDIRTAVGTIIVTSPVWDGLEPADVIDVTALTTMLVCFAGGLHFFKQGGSYGRLSRLGVNVAAFGFLVQFFPALAGLLAVYLASAKMNPQPD